jgi:hypothetical protein
MSRSQLALAGGMRQNIRADATQADRYTLAATGFVAFFYHCDTKSNNSPQQLQNPRTTT